MTRFRTFRRSSSPLASQATTPPGIRHGAVAGHPNIRA